jgi:hypothetical protein
LNVRAQVSYLEIYNDVGYDLLDPNHDITKMEDLPKVELLDTGGSEVILRNLSQNAVATEEDALNALFIGDTNSECRTCTSSIYKVAVDNDASEFGHDLWCTRCDYKHQQRH